MSGDRQARELFERLRGGRFFAQVVVSAGLVGRWAEVKRWARARGGDGN